SKERRRLRRVAALENAGRPALIRFLTAPQALHRFALRDVIRGSHTFERPAHVFHQKNQFEATRVEWRVVARRGCLVFCTRSVK
ncbi:hypothetical protein, partial [Burkholderia seminalis]|uniref:hypothetical protein n=1 Tax=Burkholderia seminalis TaxID=488731 RepID=UPI001ABB16C6